MTGFWPLVRHDLVISVRLGGGAFLALLFYGLVALVVPIGLGPDLPLLARVAPGIAWVGAALAVQVSLDRLFQADHEEGALDILVASPLALELVVLAKCLAHWLVTGLPLVLFTPVFALFFALEERLLAPLMVSLLIGTPALSLTGAVGAALTVGLRRGGVLISLLVLPLYVPIIVFGVGAVAEQAELGLLRGPSVLIEAAIALISGVTAALAGAAALRLQAE